MLCETLRRGSELPASCAVEAHDWRSLHRDEPTADVSICRPAGTGESAPIPTVRCRARAAKHVTRIHPRDRDRNYVRPVTDSRAHDPKRLPLDQLLRARTPLVSKPPTPHPHFRFGFEPKPAPVKRELSRADRASYAVLGTAVCAPCTDSLALAARSPSGVFPRSSFELGRAFPACLPATERHDRDAPNQLLLTRALVHENP